MILRPSALSDDDHGTGHVALAIAGSHQNITRGDVASTIAALIEQPAIRRIILVVTGGDVPISEAVAALVRI